MTIQLRMTLHFRRDQRLTVVYANHEGGIDILSVTCNGIEQIDNLSAAELLRLTDACRREAKAA